MSSAGARAVSVGLLALGLCGCPSRGTDDIVWSEDFESVCEGGTPCGWVQSGGPDGAARYVDTVPGDHGLELIGDGVVVRGPSTEALPAVQAGIRAFAVRMSARCDFGSSIEVRASFERPTEPSIFTLGTDVVPGADWSGLLPDQTLIPVDAAAGVGPFELRRVLGVSLLKHGEGACELDRIAIRAIR